MTRRFLTPISLPSAVELEGASVGHPFQIGSDDGPNLAMDNDEIVARGGLAYLTPGASGYASTPDADDLSPTATTPCFRWTAKVRADNAEDAVSRYIIRKNVGGQAEYIFGATFSSTFYGLIGWADLNGATQLTTTTTRTLMNLTPPGYDRYVGAAFGNVGGTGNLNIQHSSSPDGVAWSPVGNVLTNVPTSYLAHPGTALLQIGQGWSGRIYWAQVAQMNARLNFTGTVGTYVTVPNQWTVSDSAATHEIFIRVTADWKAPPAAGDYHGLIYMPARLGLRRVGTGNALNLCVYAPDGTAVSPQATVPATWETGQTVWLRVTTTTAPAVTLYWAPDSPTVPTSWTQLATATPTAAGLRACSAAVTFGADSAGGTSRNLVGNLRRMIIRDVVGGANVLDIDDSSAAVMATATTFPATTGQTVTVTGSIVQPAADSPPIWRFDAADYPGSGTTWTDPRGRSWSLVSGATITSPTPSTLQLQTNGSPTTVGGNLTMGAGTRIDAQAIRAVQNISNGFPAITTFHTTDFLTRNGYVGEFGGRINLVAEAAGYPVRLESPTSVISRVAGTDVLQVQSAVPQVFVNGQISNLYTTDNTNLVLRSDYSGGGPTAGPAIGFYNAAGSTRHAWVQGKPEGMRFELPSSATKWAFTVNNIDQARINIDGSAWFNYFGRFGGGLGNLCLQLEGLFAGQIDFWADRYPGGVAPPGGGNQKRGSIQIDGTESCLIDTLDITGGLGDILLRPGGTERFRVTKAGSPTALITANSGEVLRLIGGAAGASWMGVYDTSANRQGYFGAFSNWFRMFADTTAALPCLMQSGGAHCRVQANTYVEIYSGGSYTGRFDTSSHFIMFKTTTTISDVGTLIAGTDTANIQACNDLLNQPLLICNKIGAGNAAGADAIHFRLLNTTRGSVTHPTTTTTAYNTSSDYRLKDVLGPVASPLERLMLLKPWHVRWKENGEEQDTFLAHEVAEVVSVAVTGVKDAVEPEDDDETGAKAGDIIPQQLDASKLIPLLTAAVQELTQRVITLENA